MNGLCRREILTMMLGNGMRQRRSVLGCYLTSCNWRLVSCWIVIDDVDFLFRELVIVFSDSVLSLQVPKLLSDGASLLDFAEISFELLGSLLDDLVSCTANPVCCSLVSVNKFKSFFLNSIDPFLALKVCGEANSVDVGSCTANNLIEVSNFARFEHSAVQFVLF